MASDFPALEIHWKLEALSRRVSELRAAGDWRFAMMAEIEAGQVQAELDAALRRLSPDARACFGLAVEHGFSIERIGARRNGHILRLVHSRAAGEIGEGTSWATIRRVMERAI